VGPRVIAVIAAVIATACALGCGETEDRRPSTTGQTTSRAKLFGAPELVPTREGEAIRRELATSAEIRDTLAGVLVWEIEHVQVRLPTRAGPPGHVTVVLKAGGEPSELSDSEIAQTRKIVAGVVPVAGWTADQTDVVLAPSVDVERPPPADTPRDVLLALCLIGFGASFGIVIDRSRRRGTR